MIRKSALAPGPVGLLAHELVAAVRSYYFSYERDDMMRAISIWRELRPLLVDTRRGFLFRFTVKGSRNAKRLRSTLASSASISSVRLRRSRESTDPEVFVVRCATQSLAALTDAVGTAGGPVDSIVWSVRGQRPVPNELVVELDRLQRVLEWTCDFEAAHSLYPAIPNSATDSARAAIFLLASQWQPIVRSSEGWTVHDVYHPEFHMLEERARQFEQAMFEEGADGALRVSGSRSVVSPRRGYTLVAGAELFGGGTVMTAAGLVDFDPCQRSVFDFVAGRWDHVVGSGATLAQAAVRLPTTTGGSFERGILLSGRADMNWYHWMIEHLPRLIQVDNVVEASVPVVVSDRLALPALDAVRAVTDREIIVAPIAERTRFASLYLPSNTVVHTDTLEIDWDKGTSIDFDAVEELARRILAARGSVDPTSPKRIFWFRESTHRNLTNQRELVDVAIGWGFTVIQPEDCSLADQVRLFQNAEVVISAMGAVTPNFLFMRPDTHIVSLTSRASADYVFPGVIGHHVTGSFRTLVGEFKKTGHERSRLDYFHQPFHIAPEHLENELNQVLNPR